MSLITQARIALSGALRELAARVTPHEAEPPAPVEILEAVDPVPFETENSLNTEYCNWCGENGLDWVCAEENLLREDLTPEQRCWLHAFMARFDEAIERVT